jgi:hypothetical protein
MDLSLYNTVESRLVLHHENVKAELAQAAQRALLRMEEHHLEKATVRSVVTRFKPSRSIRGKRYTKVHTMDYAVWAIDRIGNFLCSNGEVYSEQRDRDFWNRKIENLMPLNHTDSPSYDYIIKKLDDVGIKSLGITGFGW